MSRPEQLREITPRSDCTESQLHKALKDAGHDCVLGVTTSGSRWFLSLGREVVDGEAKRTEDATELEAANAAMASLTIKATDDTVLCLELERVLSRIVALEKEPVIFFDEILDLEKDRASLVARINEARGA